MTRNEIENLKVGDMIQYTLDLRNCKALPDARWSEPKPVVEIFAVGNNVHGRAYICLYREVDANCRMSHSCTEGEELIRLAQ